MTPETKQMKCVKVEYPQFIDYQFVVDDGGDPNDIIDVQKHGGRKHTTVRCKACRDASHTYIGKDTGVWPEQPALGWTGDLK